MSPQHRESHTFATSEGLAGPAVRRPAVKRGAIVGAFALAFLLAGMGPGLHAQAVACDDLQDTGERMKCKHGRLLDEQEKVINNLEFQFGDLVPVADIDRLKKAHGRAKKAKDRASSKEFKALARKKQEICDLAELIGDGKGNDDGICEPGERCEEIIGDGIGDDVQPCKVKGKSKEACVEICADAGAPEDELEDDVDVEYQADWEENYDDVTAQLEAANEVMESEGARLAAMTISLLTASEPSAACRASVDWIAYGKILTMTILKQVSVGLRGVADIAERGCDQSGAGFNCATCCIVAETLASVAALVVETADGIISLVQWGFENAKQTCMSSLSADLQQTISSIGTLSSTATGNSTQLGGIDTKMNTLTTNVGQVQAAVDLLSAKVAALQGQLDALAAAMDMRFGEVSLMLATPQGQREGFPSKD